MSEQKTALITGLTGQDGSFLAELLVSKGYNVVGIVRRNSGMENRTRLNILPQEIRDKIVLRYGDILDVSSLTHVIKETNPSELYHLAAQSDVRISYDQPQYTAEVTGIGTLNVLEAIRLSDLSIRMYQASSSEMFGAVSETPQNENTRFNPRSPYGAAKVFAHHMCHLYRASYGMHISCGILMNHESERRGQNFVTRKISIAAARIAAGLDKSVTLGNLEARRDFGYAGDYVEAMHLMLQQDKPDDYVIATGVQHSVREFCDAAFSHVGLNYQDYVKTDPQFLRPAEVDLLCGDYSKAKRVLGWAPKVSFEQLVQMMVDADVAAIKKVR
jgi:GDPmannose 4,6-dehydratase